MALYAFDGTWNVRDGADVVEYVQGDDGTSRSAFRDTVETNVHRFYEFYGPDRGEYLQGVGTRFGAAGRVFGGAFGFGGRHRIRRMYRRLCERYHADEPDHRIDIVGFSRGSALAVHFANLIAAHGVRDPARRHLSWWYERGFGLTFRFPKAAAGADRPKIHFVGLFDLVASFGLPVGPVRNVGRAWRVHSLPECVERAFHAMSLDEIRQTFELVRPSVPEGRSARLYEVWFRGAHSNIGGGYIDRGLSDIALAWMMEQAIWAWNGQELGVPAGFHKVLEALEPHGHPHPEYFGSSGREALRPDPDGSIGRTRKVPRKPRWRRVGPNERVHHTALARSRNIAADHFNLNRPLLRPIPGDHQISYDPPWLFSETVRDHAERLAQALFGAVPVRPGWLRVDETDCCYVYRSDAWIAQGDQRGRGPQGGDPAKLGIVAGTTKAFFVRVAVPWIESGGCIEHDRFELTDDELRACFGFDTPVAALAWTIHVLEVLLDVAPRTPDLAYLLERFDRSVIGALTASGAVSGDRLGRQRPEEGRG